MIAPPQGEQPRPAPGGGAENLLCLKVFKDRLGCSAADGKEPRGLPDVKFAIVARGEEGENPEVVLPNVQYFRHMSGILDNPVSGFRLPGGYRSEGSPARLRFPAHCGDFRPEIGHEDTTCRRAAQKRFIA